MAYSPILKPNALMNTVLYAGNGGTQSITGVGFQPDMTWLKKRNGTANHHLVDAVRGVGYYLYPNLGNAQGGNGATLLTSFNSDGFTLDAGADSNASGATGVGWSWKAGNLANGQGSANTDGSLSSSVSANQTSGFSIVTYNGRDATDTIGHGLGAEPSVILFKCRSHAGSDWYSYWKPLGNNSTIRLNNTGSTSSPTGLWNTTNPTSSVFTVTSSDVINRVNRTFVAYCFAEKQGFSKFGSYIGNGNADGTFVYTGFKPAWVMVKNTNAVNHWAIYDNKRIGFNTENNYLRADGSYAEGSETWGDFDLLSNGFKPRATDAMINSSGNTFIYMAFAEEPLVASNFNVATAR